MATDRSSTAYRVLLIPDERCEYGFYSPTLSTAVWAGPAPGDPEPERASAMALASGGEMAADVQYTILATRAGMPAPQGGGWLWSDGGDYLGCDEPTVVTGCEPVEWTTSDTYVDPHVIALDDGSLLMAAHRSSGVDGVLTWRRAAGATSWTAALAITDGSITWTSSPTIVQLPDSRVLLFRWVELAGDRAQVRMYYSDNRGQTWNLGQRACLQEPIDTSSSTGYQLGRLRVAYADGQLLLVGCLRKRSGVVSADERNDLLIQWASSDLGGSFLLVELSEDDATADPYPHGAFVDVAVVDDGVFVVAHLRTVIGTSNCAITVRRIGSAFDALSDQAAIEVDTWTAGVWSVSGTGGGGEVDAGGLALWVDDVGTLFLLSQSFSGGSSTGELHVLRSTDGGVTWVPMGQGPGTVAYSAVFSPGDADYMPADDWTVCAHRGRAVMVHGISPAASSTYEGSLAVAELGGFSNITMPMYGDSPLDTSRVSWVLTYTMAWTEPNGTAWAKTLSGAPTTAATSDGWWRLTTGLGEAVYYDDTFVSTDDGGVLVQSEWRVASGQGVMSARHEVGGNRYEVQVLVGTGSIVLYDAVAAANIDTKTTTVGQTAVQVLMHLVGDTVTAWYRATGAHPGAREWVEIGTSSTLTAGATTGSSRARFGAAASSQADFRDIRYSEAEWTGEGIASGQTDEQRWPRSFGALPVYVNGGTYIRATSGPAMAGDSWVIRPRYEHGPELVGLDVAASPRRGFRTTSDSAEAIIAWEWNTDQTTIEPFRGGTAFIAALGANFRTAYLEGRNNAGAWVAIGTLDCAHGMDSLAFVRRGRMLTVDTGTVQNAAHYLLPSILADSHALLDGTDVRPITRNTAGAWRDGETVHPVITLGGYDDTEPALGTLELWSKDALTLVHDASLYSAIRVRIPAQDTYEGYFTGKLVIGHAFYLGVQYSWGRIRGYEPGAELFDQRGGVRTARRARPLRRYVQLPWAGLIPVHGIQGADPDPDFVRGAVGGDPVAARTETPYALAGLLEELGGAERVIGYLEHAPQVATPSTDHHCADRARFFFGRITSSDVQVTQEYGDEGETEVVTSPGVLLQEEL